MKLSNVLISLLAIALIAIGYFAYKFFQDTEKLEEEIGELQNQLAAKIAEDEVINSWKKLDTAVYSENYLLVREIYEELLATDVLDSNEYQFRLDGLEKIRDAKQSRSNALSTLRAQVESLREELRVIKSVNILLAENESNFLDSLFSVKQRSDRKAQQLRQKLRQKEKTIDSLASHQKEMLTLEDNRGNTFYYFGPLEKGKAQGNGIGVWRNGGIYEGEWRNNRRHGEGRFEWSDDEVYEGDYVEGKREGNGTYFWTSGQKYVGEWKNDKREGEGVLYNEYGNVSYKGEWRNDSPIRE